MTQPKRIYLAGPEVFFPAGEHQAIVAEKKRLLREYGFEGVDPLDTELTFSEDDGKQASLPASLEIIECAKSTPEERQEDQTA